MQSCIFKVSSPVLPELWAPDLSSPSLGFPPQSSCALARPVLTLAWCLAITFSVNCRCHPSPIHSCGSVLTGCGVCSSYHCAGAGRA